MANLSKVVCHGESDKCRFGNPPQESNFQRLGIRSFEFQAILALIRMNAPAGARVLDIGAGTGLQAQMMTGAGYAVGAIDMPTSVYANDRVFPIHDMTVTGSLFQKPHLMSSARRMY